MKLYTLLTEKDATMLEINPMVEIDDNGRKRGENFFGHKFVCRHKLPAVKGNLSTIKA